MLSNKLLPLVLALLLIACGDDGGTDAAKPSKKLFISDQSLALQAADIDDFSGSNSGDINTYPDAPTTIANFSDFINMYPHNPCQITPDTGNYSAANSDPLRAFQWYLDAARVPQAWRLVKDSSGYQGSGIIVQIHDSGIQKDHEDLAANVIPGLNAYVPEDHPNRTNPYHNMLPIFDEECIDGTHGTLVAGIIGAVGGNRRGIIGIAPQAKLTMTNMIMLPFLSWLPTKPIIDAFTDRTSEVAISSNSWGYHQLTTLYNARPQFNDLINNGIFRGFNDKGISYFFASGNSAMIRERDRTKDHDPRIAALNIFYPQTSSMASYFSVMNHPGVMPICAVGADNVRTSYSERGGNLWLCGHSSSQSSTTIDVPVEAASNTTARRLFINDYITNATSNNKLDLLGIATTDLSLTSGINPLPDEDDSDESNGLEYSGDCTTLIYNSMVADFSAANVTIREKLDGDDMPTNCDEDATTTVSVVNLTWPEGATTSYSRFFGGTSAAAPLVAGVAALVRAANPDLTWRDVKLILADSAEPPASGSCKGGRKYSDSSSNYCHNSDYGFGIVNAEEAVKLAMDDNWEKLDSTKPFMRQTYPQSGMADVSKVKISGENNIDFIEYIQVDIESDFSNFGSLEIVLEKKLENEIRQNSIFSKPHTCVVSKRVELPSLISNRLYKVNAMGNYITQVGTIITRSDFNLTEGIGGLPDNFFHWFNVIVNEDGTFSESDGRPIPAADDPNAGGNIGENYKVYENIDFGAESRTFNNRTDECPYLKDGFTFGAASFLGMEVNGEWELRVVDSSTGQRVPVEWRMTFYGHNRE